MRLLKRIFIALVFLFLLSSLTKNFFEYRKNYSFYEEYKSEFQKAEKENVTLKTETLKKSDPNELEKVIRNKLNLLKPDEIALIIPPPTPTPVVVTPTPLPVYQQWFEIFLKN